jgi:hypothetical protein
MTNQDTLIQLGRPESTLGTADTSTRITATVHGSAVRVQHVPSQFAGYSASVTDHLPQGPTSRVVTGPVRYTVGDAAAHESGGVARYSSGSPDPAAAGIAASLSSTYGPATVDIPNLGRTRVEVAERMGLIKRDASGQWADVAPAQVAEATKALQAPQESEQEKEQDAAGVFDAQDDADWAADIAPLPQHAFETGIASTIAVLANGTGSIEATSRAIAEASGIEPALAREYVTQGIAMYERAADRALMPLLGTADRISQFREYLDQHPSAMRDALTELVYRRSPARLQEMAKQWRVTNRPDTSHLTRAGFEVAAGVEGETLVRRPGGNWVRAESL